LSISQLAKSDTILFSTESYCNKDLYSKFTIYLLFQLRGFNGFKLGKLQINHSETVPHLIGTNLESLYKKIYIRCVNESTKNRILIKNKYFFSLIILLYIIQADYGKRYNANEFNINITHNAIVVLCKTFSGHLLVFSPIHPLILAKFKLTFLFCINTKNISNTAIIISANFNISSMFLLFSK